MAKSRQQMQLILLGSLLGGGVLVVFVLLVLVPMIGELKTAKSETAELHSQLNEMRGTIRKRSLIQEQSGETLERLQEAAQRIPLPVLGNYMMGMEESILGCVDKNVMDVSAIVSAGEPSELVGGSGMFRVFQTRVIAGGGLHDLARTFYNVQREYPYASVSGATVTPRDTGPERHVISFVVSWLIWADPDNIPLFLAQEE